MTIILAWAINQFDMYQERNRKIMQSCFFTTLYQGYKARQLAQIMQLTLHAQYAETC